MQLKIINSTSCLERHLAQEGLRTIDFSDAKSDLYIYGCGPFVPGEDCDGFIEAHRTDTLIGAIAMTLEEDVLDKYSAELRKALGDVMRISPVIQAYDSMSAEWFLHYGHKISTGGHPAWLANIDDFNLNTDNWIRPNLVFDTFNNAGFPVIVSEEDDDVLGYVSQGDLGMAIWAALLDVPCILLVPHRFYWTHKRLHTLIRFANDFNCTDCLVYGDDELENKITSLKRGELKSISRELVEREKEKARKTIDSLLAGYTRPPETTDDIVAEAMGVEPKTNKRGPRELKVGDVFDPRTHYDENYYAEGSGLIYTKPDGTKAIYRGPGRDWEGFDPIAKIISALLPESEHGRNLLSLGCGWGHDVRRFASLGWDAYGVDISESAVLGCPPSVRDRVYRADFMDPEIIFKLPHQQFTVVASFDFLEHIWIEDLEPMIERIWELTEPGGITFHCVCTRGSAETDWTLPKGVRFSQQNSWLLAAGHVTLRLWGWWVKLFEKFGFVARHDLAQLFQVGRSESVSLQMALAWSPRNVLIMQRPK